MTLGDRRFYDYAVAFGFGRRSGFPVGGEVPGDLKPPEKWDSMTITRMPMGQSVTATVLQMQQAMGVIASGGVLLKPQVIRQIRDSHGELVYNFEREEVRRVISEQTARTMARLLMGVHRLARGQLRPGGDSRLRGGRQDRHGAKAHAGDARIGCDRDALFGQVTMSHRSSGFSRPAIPSSRSRSS